MNDELNTTTLGNDVSERAEALKSKGFQMILNNGFRFVLDELETPRRLTLLEAVTDAEMFVTEHSTESEIAERKEWLNQRGWCLVLSPDGFYSCDHAAQGVETPSFQNKWNALNAAIECEVKTDFMNEGVPVENHLKIADMMSDTATDSHLSGDEPVPVTPLVSQIMVQKIRTDGGTQTRAEINMLTVAEYGEAMKHGVKFPAIILFYDGIDYWLADGFHRLLAFKQYTAGGAFGLISCEVKEGTCRDAILYSAGANATHGLPRNNADKRRAVELLLKDEEWSKYSDSWIAEKAYVTQPFVSKMRRELSQNGFEFSSERKGKGGVVVDTTNIGKREDKIEEPTLPLDVPEDSPEQTKEQSQELESNQTTNEPVEEETPAEDIETQDDEPFQQVEETKPETELKQQETVTVEEAASIEVLPDPIVWVEKAVSLVIKYFPHAGEHEDRPVSLSIQVSSDSPIYRSCKVSDLSQFPAPIQKLIDEIKETLRAKEKPAKPKTTKNPTSRKNGKSVKSVAQGEN